MNTTESLPQIVGRAVRTIRTAHNATLDDVARASQQHGFTWRPGSISNFEQARGSITVTQLYGLALALSTATGDTITIANLIPSGYVEINDGLSVDAAEITAFLSGSPATPAPKLKRVGDSLPAGPDTETDYFSSPFSMRETRAAAHFNITPARLREITADLWSGTLDDYVREDTGLNSSAQAQGHSTRRAQAEIAAYLAHPNTHSATVTELHPNLEERAVAKTNATEIDDTDHIP